MGAPGPSCDPFEAAATVAASALTEPLSARTLWKTPFDQSRRQ
jgi:hypothetical protein